MGFLLKKIICNSDTTCVRAAEFSYKVSQWFYFECNKTPL